MNKGVIGIDEVGRGPLAGPVTVCAFYTSNEKALKKLIFQNTIRDSKKLSKALRNNINQSIRKIRKIKDGDIEIDFEIVSKSAAYIDTHGISKAIQVCMHTAVRKLEMRNQHSKDVIYKLDGGLRLDPSYKQQKTYIKGDEGHVSIAIASILAKVHRDTHMEKQARKFPEYDWHKNAGYGTRDHYKAIDHNGLTKLHRVTFIKL